MPRARPIALVAILLAVAAALAWVLWPEPEPPLDPVTARVADAFLDRYLAEDGRVVRHDQGGDTVSEGQAYAMLITAATGDERRFALTWEWTRTHLQRPGGLLGWRWQDGRLVDGNPAADADLDAAHALLVAAERFDHEDYEKEAKRIGAGILREEVVPAAGEPLLVGGRWARGDPAAFNLSYVSPPALARLADATGEEDYERLAGSALRVGEHFAARRPALPPDWAAVDRRGAIAPQLGPGQEAPPRFSFDAARAPVRLAAGCGERERAIAAAAWPFLRGEAGRVEGVAFAYALDGRRLTGAQYPLSTVAAAAAARSAGDVPASDRLLRSAEALSRRYPTYYGDAWVVLGRLMLLTGRLSQC